MKKYVFLNHTADMKFQAFGSVPSECFKNAAYALREIISKDKIKPVKKKEIRVSGKDYESLLYSFLEEFLFLIDTENFILSKIEKIKIDKNKFELTALVSGDSVKKYTAITDVKAITYNDMFVLKDKKGYKCQVVVDV
jgi:SHS2 domain-containing protein